MHAGRGTIAWSLKDCPSLPPISQPGPELLDTLPADRANPSPLPFFPTSFPLFVLSFRLFRIEKAALGNTLASRHPRTHAHERTEERKDELGYVAFNGLRLVLEMAEAFLN